MLRTEQARAHHGLARDRTATGEPDQARRHRHRALALFTELGVPEVDQVHAELTARGGPDGGGP